jgi:hypothetical protein
MKIKLPLKVLDFPVLVIALALTGISTYAAYAPSHAGRQVIIQGSGRTWVYPLDAEETVAIPGPLGNTSVEIRDHRARVLSSPCANQTCVAAGHIDAAGQWAACLPNNVLVLIRGYDESEKDDETEYVDFTTW